MRFLLAALFATPLILGAPAEGDAAGKNKNNGKGGPTLTTTQGKAGIRYYYGIQCRRCLY